MPAFGEYNVRIWLEDSAGNVNSANKAGPVLLRYGTPPPPPPPPGSDGNETRSWQLHELEDQVSR